MSYTIKVNHYYKLWSIIRQMKHISISIIYIIFISCSDDGNLSDPNTSSSNTNKTISKPQLIQPQTNSYDINQTINKVELKQTKNKYIKLNGDNPLMIEINTKYIELGAVAINDNTTKISMNSNIDISKVGIYDVTYSLSHNTSKNLTRKVHIIDVIPPVITINGARFINLRTDVPYTDKGATAIDDVDGHTLVSSQGSVDTSVNGTYEIIYKAVDKSGNEAIKIRTVKVYNFVSTPTPSTIVIKSIPRANILSPKDKSTTPYNVITLEISEDIGNTVSRSASNKIYDIIAINLSNKDSSYAYGVKTESKFLIHNMPLIKGENKIEITSKDKSVKSILTINSLGEGLPSLSLNLNKTKGFGELNATAGIASSIANIDKYYISIDDNKSWEINNTSNVKLNFSKMGRYKPQLIIRTDDNMLYTTSSTVNIVEKPQSLGLSIEANTSMSPINKDIQDIQMYKSHIYTLSNNEILKISIENIFNVEKIELVGLNEPKGFSIASNGDIFIADTLNNRIVKLLHASNYSIDTSFSLNTAGTRVGELALPLDVSVGGEGEDLEVFVLDSGNNRIQIFDYVGIYLDSFNGSSSSDGALNNPSNMIGSNTLIITDTGNKMLRSMSYNQTTKKLTSKKILSLESFGKVTYSTNGILLPDNTNKQFIFMYLSGDTISTIPNTEDIHIALAYDQNDRIIQVSKNPREIKYIPIPKTSIDASPKVLGEKFVKAYLDSDTEAMLNIAPKSLIDKLNTKDDLIKTYFKAIGDYRESIYFYGKKAQVLGQIVSPEHNVTKDSNVSIKFYFNWSDDKWVMESVM